MANEITISFFTGAVITVKLYDATGAQVGATINSTEIGAIGEYLASVPAGVPYGFYRAVGFYNGEKMGVGDLYWDGVKEITPIMYERLHRVRGLDTAHPATNTQSSLVAGDININITGDLENTATYTATT